MSEVSNILTSIVDIKRFTASVVDRVAIASSISPTRQPAKTCRIEVTIEGCTVNNGLVSIAGSNNEQIAFTQNGDKVGVKDFSSISGITISGLTGGYIKLKAVSDMGEPVNQLYLLAAGVSCRFFQQLGQQREHFAGQEQLSRRTGTGVMMEPEQDLKVGDWLFSEYGMVGQTILQATFVEALYGFDGLTHHIEGWLNQV